MSPFTKEEKTTIALKGVEEAFKLFNTLASQSKHKQHQALDGDDISIEDYKALVNRYEEYETYIHNLINDTELGCKFKKTEEIFLDIIRIIMFDLEHDYPEIIENFSNAIDNQIFIDAHEEAVKKREERLDKEYQEALKLYELELKEYEIKVQERKSSGFFKRLLSSDSIEPPTKPERRE